MFIDKQPLYLAAFYGGSAVIDDIIVYAYGNNAITIDTQTLTSIQETDDITENLFRRTIYAGRIPTRYLT